MKMAEAKGFVAIHIGP